MVNRESPTSRRPADRWKWRLRLGSLAAFALGWELLAHTLDSLLLPTFTETLVALGRLLATGRLWEALWISNQAMAIGFALAAVVGVFLGLLMGRWRAVEKFVDPYLNILLVTPMSALIPVIIMAMGLGLASRVAVVFSFAVVIITVNTRAGARMVDPSWIEMAQAFGATERQMWLKVLLRGALAGILTGLRLGMMRAISGMVTVELLLIAVGVGRLILDLQGNFEAAGLYATIIVVVAESVILLLVFKRLERRAAPWDGEGVTV
jgi:NitT/TauT family transport system permease protein